MAGRNSLLVDMFEAEDSAGRRVEILRYRELKAKASASDGVLIEYGGDEWFERAGERLVTTDGTRFRSRHRHYVRVVSC